MLPAELAAQYGVDPNDPAFLNYMNWQQETGGDWSWWSDAAAQAADAAGISRYSDAFNQGLLEERKHPWGENYHVNKQTGQTESITNPGWVTWINQYMAQHGPGNAATNEGSPSFYTQAAPPEPVSTAAVGTPVTLTPEQLAARETANAKANDMLGMSSDPMTTSRLAQRAESSQQQLAKLLANAIGANKAVKNPFTLARAFGGGAMPNPFLR